MLARTRPSSSTISSARQRTASLLPTEAGAALQQISRTRTTRLTPVRARARCWVFMGMRTDVGRRLDANDHRKTAGSRRTGGQSNVRWTPMNLAEVEELLRNARWVE